jgi:uncharacterized protein YjbI with pentapeptide repeats
MPAPSAATRQPKPPKRRAIELPDLLPYDGRPLTAAGEHERTLFEGADLTGQIAPTSHLTECRMHDCTLDDVDLRRARLHDTILSACQSSTLDLTNARLHDVKIDSCRIGALLAPDTAIKHVTVTGGRWTFVNLRSARLTDVVFEGVRFDDLDLSGATLERVSFDGCTIGTLSLHAASLADVDLSGATLRDVHGIEHLRGASVSPGQLMQLAPVIATHLGIQITGT